MTTSRVSAVLAAAVIFSAACADRTPPAIGQLTIAEPARPEAPLGVLVAVTTDEPARLSIEIADGTRVDHIPAGDTYRTEHRVPVVGLRPGRRHEVSFIATDAAGNSDRTPPLIIETDPLPDDFPPLEVTASQPDRMEPGATLLGVYRWEANGPAQDFGLLLAVDSAGEVVWYYRGDHRTGHAIPLANGNLLYQAAPGGIWGILVEIDLLGNVVRRWHSRAVVDRVPDESILVDVDSLHHDVIELPSGHFATLSTELRTYDDYPTSDRDPDAPRESQDIAGDIIVEFAPDGTIVQRWPLLDLIDPYRIGYDSLGTGFWTGTYRALGHAEPDIADWAHANALAYDEVDDAFVVSLRHQDALVKVDRAGEVRWILGPHTGWNAPWQTELLEPIGDLEWPFHSHGLEVTPDGTLLLFDNGNHRATPFDEPLPAESAFSRAVEFDVDDAAMTVRQRWAHAGAGAARFHSSFLSDADWLPETGNILITDGARTREIEGDDGEPVTRRGARIVEVTRTTPAETVFELVIDDDEGPTGWHVYRAGRWSAQYPN